MGLFDYIRYSMKCPKCGKIVDDFQSKDKEDAWCRELDSKEVNNLYSECGNCKAWIEINIEET